MSVPSHAEDVWWPEAVPGTDTANLSMAPNRPGWRLWAARAAGSAADAVTGLLYPPACLACPVLTGAPGGLCPACWQAMPVIERPYCERLGTPFALDIGGTLLSPAAIAEPPVFARARAV